MKKCAYCGRLNNDSVETCAECGTTLPRERFEAIPHLVRTAAELRARRRALRDALLWMVLSVGVLAMGWLYPAWFFGRDPIMQRDTDPRVGPALMFCLIASCVFAVLAVRSFRHVRGAVSP
jgi:hypothetical protein